MNLFIIFSILIIHFIADFVLQTSWQATNKSKNNIALTKHVLVYSSVWLLASMLYGQITENYLIVFLFPLITFICHWITDYITSRVNSHLWSKGETHNFFVSVGFDQVLHYVQLFLTFHFLNK